MIAESFYSNLYAIRGISENSYIKAATVIIFIGNVLTIMISLLPAANLQGKRSTDLIFILIGCVGCLTSALLLPVLIGRIVQCQIPDFQIATTSPLGGTAQNGFLVWVLILLGGTIPVYFSCISKNLICLICGVISIVYTIYWPLSYCVSNNVRHLKKRTEEYLKYVGQKEADMA